MLYDNTQLQRADRHTSTSMAAYGVTRDGNFEGRNILEFCAAILPDKRRRWSRTDCRRS
jgi:uncharacterized protein YyaL (SSP411 family)